MNEIKESTRKHKQIRIWIKHEYSQYRGIKVGVSQGTMLSTLFFNNHAAKIPVPEAQNAILAQFADIIIESCSFIMAVAVTK